MGRLIDEDMLMERLGFLNTPQEREENAGQIITLEDFDSIPTAYDVDKVVEELEENASRYTKKYVTPYGNNGYKDTNASRYTKKYVTPYGNNGYKDTKAISIHKAIEIVKHGIVSDDVCEWREEGLFLFTSCGDRVKAYSDDFKYCPYCSKKIKVVK